MQSRSYLIIAALAVVATAGRAGAQALPRIAALYPAGAKAGSTVEVAIRGGGLDGARQILIEGSGISAKLNTADVKIAPDDQKAFQGKCGLCHELRGPSNISRTAEQWVATVDRMIRDRGAPIESADREKIVRYVQAAARAAAGLTAQVTVAPDAAPGTRSLRVVGANGTSTVYPFEVSAQPETLEAEPNNEVPKAPAVSLPVTVNGQIASGDADCFAFQAKQGERLVFNCSAYRMNPSSQGFLFPVLYLYDEKGKELARNTGYFSLDPLIDWTAPADGKYVVLVRDMLYRGSPGSVYRLSIGSLPYKTYLFPPGGQRGTTTSTQVAGENMQPATLEVPVDAKSPAGVRRINTAHGSFPFVVGEYPEVTEPEGTPGQTLTLPASVNARLDKSDVDRYPFTLEKEQLGTYSFELYAERIDSPLVGRLRLLNARGQQVAVSTSGAGTRDARIDYTFSQPGEYTLEVADQADRFSPAHIYRISAGPSAPDFALTISPDNPNLGPGASVYLAVRVQRRVAVPGEIEVVLTGLPKGVTASRCVIPPGENQAFVILTAAPDAQPGAFAEVRAVGKSVVDGKTLERDALPYEIYRINNNAQIAYRSDMVVTIGPSPDWTVSVEPGTMSLSPDSEPVEVKVRLHRKGNERDLPFAIIGVPRGVEAPRSVLFKKGVSEMTFTLKPTNGGVFEARRAGDAPPPPFTFTVVFGREGEGMMMASPPVTVAVTPAKK